MSYSKVPATSRPFSLPWREPARLRTAYQESTADGVPAARGDETASTRMNMDAANCSTYAKVNSSAASIAAPLELCSIQPQEAAKIHRKPPSLAEIWTRPTSVSANPTDSMRMRTDVAHTTTVAMGVSCKAYSCAQKAFSTPEHACATLRPTLSVRAGRKKTIVWTKRTAI